MKKYVLLVLGVAFMSLPLQSKAHGKPVGPEQAAILASSWTFGYGGYLAACYSLHRMGYDTWFDLD